MVDIQKIDTFFNSKQASKTPQYKKNGNYSSLSRFAKLIMPSIAAVFIGMVFILPVFKKNNMITTYDTTMPKKGELEKLHAENTSFSITDKEGKVSSFTADTMDETEKKSKIIKITNPKGKIPLKTDNTFVDIIADTGFFNQIKNIITVQKNVRAVYNNDTTFETEKAQYDFNNAYGKGYTPLYAHGSFGKLWADTFAYDKNKDILYLKGNSKLIHKENILKAFQQVRYYKTLNKIEAEGNVMLEEPERTLYADKIVIWLENSKQMKPSKIEAFKNVKIVNTNMTVSGDYGIYIPEADKIELQGNVSIEKDGNVIYGDKIITNPKTKISHLITTQNKKRVSGIIKGSNIKRSKNEKD